MNQPTITIAIPYYERRKYLRRAIDSVLSQTIDRWRLVICDNCSSHDFAEELVASLADDRVSYFREPGRVSRAECFNRGIELAETDLVVLLHDDDELLPGYCELMLDAAEQFPTAAAFYCRARIIGENSRPVVSLRDSLKAILTGTRSGATTLLQGESAVVALLRANFIYGPSVCYRKSQLVEKKGSAVFDAKHTSGRSGQRLSPPFSPKWDQVLDMDLHVRLLMNGEMVVGLRPIAYCYRRHPDQATVENLQSMRYFEEEAGLFDELANKAGELGWSQAAKVARQKRVTKMQLLYQCVANALRLRWREAGKHLAFFGRL